MLVLGRVTCWFDISEAASVCGKFSASLPPTWAKKTPGPGDLGYVGIEILPNYIGFIIHHDKDSY